MKTFSINWPPGFKSRLTNKADPLSMMPRACGVSASQVSTANRERLVEAGNWAAKGSLGPLSDKAQMVFKRDSRMSHRGR